MARMTGKSKNLHTCVYGCCSDTGTDKTMSRRLARRRERQALLREISNDLYAMKRAS